MRERTTWNRDAVTAATTRTADPYAMNQDHLQQQPKADKYLTGDPSSFAEDITEPNTWDREYAGGATERNEIGMPAFRDETFNHAEKSASTMDEKTLIKKADLCTTVARMILRGRKFATAEAATEAVESQAVSLMYMPNADLINMASRLAAQEDFPGGQTWPSQFAGDQQQQQAGDQQQQQAAQDQQAAAYQQAAQQCMQAFQKGDQQGVQAAIEQMVQQAAKMHQARRAAEEGQQQEQGQQQQQAGQQDQQQQAGQQDQQQGQQAGQQQQQAQMDEQALEQMLSQAVQQQEGQHQGADYDAKRGPAINPPGYGPYNGPQAGGMKAEPGTKGARKAADEQGQQQGQQQQQAGQQQQGQPQQQQGGQQQDQQAAGYQQQQQGGQGQQQMPMADDQLLDDMLMGPQAGGMSEVDIEMEPSQMDVGEIVLSATDDEVLKTLFANEETEQAEQAKQQQKQGGMARTASVNPSTRTVGTRPSGGVSKVGGAPAGRSGSDVDSLTALWPSAPDVREAFNIR